MPSILLHPYKWHSIHAGVCFELLWFPVCASVYGGHIAVNVPNALESFGFRLFSTNTVTGPVSYVEGPVSKCFKEAHLTAQSAFRTPSDRLSKMLGFL